MERLTFERAFDMANTITAILGDINDDYPVISVYGNFEVIKELLVSLIVNGVIIGSSIELEDCTISNYDKEFELSITEDGVDVCKLWHEDNEYHKAGYYYSGANIAFVHEDCSSKILPYIKSEYMYEFSIGEEEKKTEKEHCECCKRNSDNDVKKKENKYIVNGRDVDKETYYKSLEDAIEFLDEMKVFRKLFFW